MILRQRILLLAASATMALGGSLLFAQPKTDSSSDWNDIAKRLGPAQSTEIAPAVRTVIENAPLPVEAVPVAAAPLPSVSAPARSPSTYAPKSPLVGSVASSIETVPSAVAPAPTVAVSPAAKQQVIASALADEDPPAADLTLSYGRFISSDRDALYNSGKYVELNYVDEPIQNVLRRLARTSGINFVMPHIDGAKVSLTQRGNPFSIMEALIESQGMGLVKRNDSWLITSLDRVNLAPQVYKLKHIHLDREFSFQSKDGVNGMSGSSGSSGGSSSGGGNSYGSGGGGSYGGSGGQNGGGSALVTSSANLEPPRSVNERSSGNSQILETLDKILEFGMDNTLGGGGKVNINDKASAGDKGKSASKGSSKAIYSYDPDANSLFVVATEQQHSWVKKWIETLDQPTRNIEISVQFISTGKSNGSAAGIDWSGGTGNGLGNGIPLLVQDAAVSSGATASTAGSGLLTFGALNNLRAPTSAILSAGALNLKLQALLTNSDTKTTRKPLLTTLTNREVLINNTQNQPVVLASATGSTSTGSTGGSTTSTSSNSISNENIGTITRILPRIISDDLISLSINIEITNLLRTTIINGNEYPIIARTGFTNEVKVRSGYAVVVGGLEEMITKNTIKQLPILGRIPFFGFAFKDIVKGEDVSNLSLVITVRIIDESGEEYHRGQDSDSSDSVAGNQ